MHISSRTSPTIPEDHVTSSSNARSRESSPGKGQISQRSRPGRASVNLSLKFPVECVDEEGGTFGIDRLSSPGGSSKVTSPALDAHDRRASPAAESNTFLTDLATQERRVLELKEELQRAEQGLDLLKRHWARHEAMKKRNELRKNEGLRPLVASPTNTMLNSITEPSVKEKEQPRQNRMPNGRRHSQRIFSGSQHTRALSLLSSASSFASGTSTGRSTGPTSPVDMPEPYKQPSRSPSLPIDNVTRSSSIVSMPPPSRPSLRPPKDAMLETGKLIVGELREGLWTFIEDLRQVAVGDDAAPVQSYRPSPYVEAKQTSAALQPQHEV
ncbi:hypothetical protein MMC09_001194 [Bachmanniomyces sp. S44760]|nr:hypothetical protein [Bachmanniomyces sp. S44760]